MSRIAITAWTQVFRFIDFYEFTLIHHIFCQTHKTIIYIIKLNFECSYCIQQIWLLFNLDRIYLNTLMSDQDSCTSLHKHIGKQSSEMGEITSIPFKIGKHPVYIEPKKIGTQNNFSQVEINSSCEFNSSIMPNFHCLQNQNNEAKPFQSISEHQSILIADKQQIQQSNPVINFTIWMAYLLGSVQTTTTTITWWHGIDIFGNILALYLIVKTLYVCKRITIQHLLYIWSIILTVTFLAYNPGVDGNTFISAISLIRSIRLLFPIFILNSFFDLFKKIKQILNKVKKIVFAIIILLIIFSFITFQMYSSALHNQCRVEDIPKGSNWISIDQQRLCGSRMCPQNTFCRNPKQLQVSINPKQIDTESLNYGFYEFNNIFSSIFANFEIVSLNSWSRISLIYFDSYSPYIGSLVFVCFCGLIQILLIMLIIVFFDYCQENKESLYVQKIKQKKSQNGQGINININQQNNNINSVIHNPLGSNAELLSKRSLKLPQGTHGDQYVGTPIDLQQYKIASVGKQNQFCNCLNVFKSIFVLIFVATHIVLAFSFGLSDTNIKQNFTNRLIGIILCIIYIIQSFALTLAIFVFSLTDNSQSQQKCSYEMQIQKQVTTSIVNLEILIWMGLTVDYVARVLQQKYIMEERSIITPFSHFTLCLRFYYIYVIVGLFLKRKLFLNQMLIINRVVKSIFRYIIIFMCVSCTLAVLNFNIFTSTNNNSQTKNLSNLYKLVLQINRFIMFFTNNSWGNLLTFGNQTYTTTALNMVFAVTCAILGEFVIMKFIIGSIIQKTRDQCLQISNFSTQQSAGKTHHHVHTSKNLSHKNIRPQTYKQINVQSQLTDEQTHLKKQKSFFVFSYQNCLRSFALQTIRNQYFKDVIRFRFYVLYVIMAAFGILSFDITSYRIFAMVLQFFVIMDLLLQKIALRVFGQYSYVDGQTTPILNVLVTILIYVVSGSSLFIQTLPVLQLTRIFIVLSYFQSIKHTLQFLKQSTNVFIRNLFLLFPIVVGIAIMLFPIQFQGNSGSSIIQNLVKSLKYSTVVIFQKGWDLKVLLNTDTLGNGQSQFLILFISLINFSFTICIFYSLSGFILSKLKKNEESQQLEVVQKLFSQQMLQEEKIRQYILSLNPQFDEKLHDSQGFLSQICTHDMFKICQFVCTIGAILSFIFLTADMGVKLRICVYSAHLFFLTFQIGLFIVKSLAYNQNQNHFVRDLILIIIAIPGAYIGFVSPVSYSSEPKDLTPVLVLFNIFPILRLFKIVQKLTFFKQIVHYINSKAGQFQNVFLIFSCIGLALSYFHYLLFNKNISILQSINYTIGGVLGADFYHSIITLQARYPLESSTKIQILLFCIHSCHLIFKNLMIAFVIFEISDFGRQYKSKNNTDYTLFNFKKYLHQEKLLEEWKKIDPKGRGLVNYRQILFKNHKFFECFSVSKIPYKSIQNRIFNFKQLGLPVYELQSQFEDTQKYNSKTEFKRQYVLLFHDFLYMLSKLIFQQMKDTKLINQKTHFTFNQNYRDQPVSMININTTQKHLSAISTKKEFRQNYKKYLEEWKVQSSKRVRDSLKQIEQEYPELSDTNCFLRATALKTTQLYSAYKMVHKLKRFQIQVQTKNQQLALNI